MKPASKTFCILPWMHLSAYSSGNLRVCCSSVPEKNKIITSKGTPYTIYGEKKKRRGSLKSAWHSSFYKKIRRQMLKGEQPKVCAPCFTEELAGLESQRMRFNRKYMFDYESSETPPFNIKFLDFKLSNKCNLKCRMCNPWTSNALLKEWEKLSKQNVSSLIASIDESEKLRIKKLNRLPSMDFSSFLEFMPSIEEIHLTGGEPLLIKEYYELLHYIIQKGFAPNIKLRYHTNITKYNEKILDLWKKFKAVQVDVSIDAFGSLNNYIRYPSKWSLIENNLNKMISSTKHFSNVIIEVDCVVQMYNITSMTDFLLWMSKKNISLFFGILDEPKFLNIRVLPSELKKKVKEELLPFRKNFPVERIINYMEKEDWTSYLPLFFRYTDFFDKSRNQKMSDILPELSSYREVL